MNINATSRQLLGQIVREYLHIAREHHQFGTGFVDNLNQPLFLLGFGIRCDWQMNKAHTFPFDHGA